MLYYLPLEAYNERYTKLMSCVDGWTEDNLKKEGVKFVRIDGEPTSSTIKNGVVLDACGRSIYAMSQMIKMVKLINDGVVTDKDVIYLEDFWHPGVESLFYIRHLTKINFKIGCFIHAQSVDDTDFAYSMRQWMRPIEIGYGQQYDYIFTCSKILKKLCIKAGIATDNIYCVGLPYNSNKLKNQLIDMGLDLKAKKQPYVIFSSRFDEEKDPMFFLELVRQCPDIEFRLVNPRKDSPISNNELIVNELDRTLVECRNLKVVNTFNKKDYYDLLIKAKVQFNCAHQDWVSWTLLEATTFNCLPLYPIWKDFPLELRNDERFLYTKSNIQEAKDKLYLLINSDYHAPKYIVEKHDNSWHQYLEKMCLLEKTYGI